jgi:hypothetical protein
MTIILFESQNNNTYLQTQRTIWELFNFFSPGSSIIASFFGPLLRVRGQSSKFSNFMIIPRNLQLLLNNPLSGPFTPSYILHPTFSSSFPLRLLHCLTLLLSSLLFGNTLKPLPYVVSHSIWSRPEFSPYKGTSTSHCVCRYSKTSNGTSCIRFSSVDKN